LPSDLTSIGGKNLASNIVIHSGSTITGHYKIPRTPFRDARIEVASILEFSGRRKEQQTYFFGRFWDRHLPEKLVAMRAQHWNPFTMQVKTDLGCIPPTGNWFVTPGDSIFLFIENVPPGDQDAARLLGASPISEFAVDEFTYINC
jgi:hypothetical protein